MPAQNERLVTIEYSYGYYEELQMHNACSKQKISDIKYSMNIMRSYIGLHEFCATFGLIQFHRFL